MKCTTLLTEWDIQHFLGSENGELLDEIYFLESNEISYVMSVRDVQYEITVQNFEIRNGLTRTFYETLLDAMNAFDEMVENLPDDANMYLADVHTGQVIADIENFTL